MARVLSAIVFIPVLLLVIWQGSPIYFAVLIAAAATLALFEFRNLAKHIGLNTGAPQMILAGIAILAAFYFKRLDLVVLSLAVLVIVELAVQLFTNRILPKSLENAAATVFGVAYITVLGGYLVLVRVIPDGGTRLPAKLISLFFLIVFAGDTGAYYTGRLLGRHKLAPSISPGKTIEGLIGGLAANVLAVVVSHYTFFPELPLITAIPLALVMGGLGVVGDLSESMLKRGSQVKDAAHLIPGHGGVLDRLDSILFNAPVIYYYYEICMNHQVLVLT